VQEFSLRLGVGEKLRRDRVFIVIEEEHRRLTSGGITRFHCRWLSSVANHLIKFVEVLRRENGWLEFSVENSKNPASCQIS
jgi:hypothetical protein